MSLNFREFVAERCWPGYKPAPGKPAYSKGSCVKEEAIDEMDKSAPQPGRDGKVSHSTYGSRDKEGSDYFKGREAPSKPITLKQMSKDAVDILKKLGMAEEIKDKYDEGEYDLKEYLTPKQKESAGNVKMSPEAKKATDHFFGLENDVKKEDIINYEHDKSEVHKKVENHLGQPLAHDEYKSGIIKDKYGRPTKIGRLIKDEKLRNEFASDNTRSGTKSVKKPYMSIVRGVGVMGQTNPEPDEIHPTGHSWKDASCKNIKDGCNRRYLKQEVKHGTVVVFGHDHDGKEIYRATLQPHHNDVGHVAYGLDGQYGIKHPSFTAHAKNVAERLTGEHKGGSLLYRKHPKVYDDIGNAEILHPKATPEHISKALEDDSPNVRSAAIQHPNATSEHISKALADKDSNVRRIAIQHPNATPEHISKALGDKDPNLRRIAIQHPNATPEHISKALGDKYESVRQSAILHPKATPEHISKALADIDSSVRREAIQHPNATPEHISKALGDKDSFVRINAIQHPNATPEHISKALADKNSYVSEIAKKLQDMYSNKRGGEITEEIIKEGMFSKKYPPPMHMIIRGYYDNMKRGYSEDEIIHHYNNAYGLKLKPGDIEKHIAKDLHSEDWQAVNRKDKTDGLSPAAVKAYRRENPGSKLQTAVTEKNPKGKRAKRRLSFCRRMKGMKSRLTSAENSRDPDSPINKALRRWNC